MSVSLKLHLHVHIHIQTDFYCVVLSTVFAVVVVECCGVLFLNFILVLSQCFRARSNSLKIEVWCIIETLYQTALGCSLSEHAGSR